MCDRLREVLKFCSDKAAMVSGNQLEAHLASLSIGGSDGAQALAEALRHGRKERANPGRDGKPRTRVTHKGAAFIISDETLQEVASWRIDDDDVIAASLEAVSQAATHMVFVVDHR